MKAHANYVGVVEVTMIDPGPIHEQSPAEVYEKQHLEELAEECRGLLCAEVRAALAKVPQAEELIKQGKWKSAERILKHAGYPHEAWLLGLETPGGLER